ncbi:MAG: cytochrome b5 domain-containing protein [Candidatus Saccharibacteria bacterium]
MKRTIIILILFIIIIAGLVLFLNQKGQAPAGPPSDSAIATEIKLETITKHNTTVDCWVAIGGSVYRLDSFLTKHPDENLANQLCGMIEPEVKLPDTLKAEVLASYRIGLLSP